MRWRQVAAAAFIIGGLGVLAVPALAQGATIRIDPDVVPAEAGEQVVAISGQQFSESGFVLLCPDLDGDVSAGLDDPSGSCDLNQLTSYSTVDGEWSISLAITITEEMVVDGGLAIIATDPAGTDVAGAVLAISDAVAAGEPLPTTGVGSAMTALGGLNMIGFGGVLMASDRRRLSSGRQTTA